MTVAESQVLGGLPYKYKGCAKMDARTDFPKKKHLAFPWKLVLYGVMLCFFFLGGGPLKFETGKSFFCTVKRRLSFSYTKSTVFALFFGQSQEFANNFQNLETDVSMWLENPLMWDTCSNEYSLEADTQKKERHLEDTSTSMCICNIM